MIRAGLAAALTLATVAAPAQETPPTTPQAAPDKPAVAEADGFALGLSLGGRFAGVVLVAEGDQVASVKAYGRRDVAQPGNLDADTRFNIGQAGRMFTAVAVLQQVAAGKLKLDTKVGKILRDYPGKKVGKDVTIRHLLTQTAGTGSVDLYGAENATNRASARTLADMVALHAAREPAGKPGREQDEGGFGYVLLGRIVEQVSGEDYETYLRRRIWEPAGMTRTGFVDCTTRAPDLAVGYAQMGGNRVSNCNTQPMRGFPGGSHVSTARDMLRFVRAFQAGTLVPAKLVGEAISVRKGSTMGLGFIVSGQARDRYWGGAGSGDGIGADVRFYPETNETAIVLSNAAPPVPQQVADFLHRRHAAR